MNYKIYYRKSLFDKDELNAARKYFDCVDLLTDINDGEFIIPRYSMYPFYLDQEREILNVGSSLINTYNQHQYVADLKNYVHDLKELTPKTWNSIPEIDEDGPYILKGETNSKKNKWNTSMFAKNKDQAIEVFGNLCQDGLIGDQHIYIRKYVPLVSYLEGFGGCPVSKEFRFFVAYGKVISGGYYWANYEADLDVKPDINEVPKEFLQEVINRIDNQCNFYVIDVAQTEAGNWIVIELNDGSQSGLSANNPEVLYKNLYEALEEHHG